MKPTIPNGWPVDLTSVSGFVERAQFTEVFSLNDGKYLYLFSDQKVVDKIVAREVEHVTIKISDRLIVGKIYNDHSIDLLNVRLLQLRQRQGFDAIAGMAELKEILIRDVVDPFLHREAYEKYRLSIPNGILFYGPPGCGKTFIANRVAEAMGVPLIEVRESDIGSPYIHATSGNIAAVFKHALSVAPSVIFLDEISGFLPKRDGMSSHMQYKEAEVSEFLVQLEGAGTKGILVIGATNFPDRIDSAVLRSGRMDKRVFIPPPDYSARVELFKMCLEDRPASEDIVVEILARETEGFVSSDIKLVVDNAARSSLRNKSLIDMKQLQSQTQNISPSISKDELERYLAFQHFERK